MVLKSQWVLFLELSVLERKYSQIEKEALACVGWVLQGSIHSCGHHFTLQTDHNHFFQATNRIQCWARTLASYEYTLTWRQSEQHCNVDALSRLPLVELPAHTTIPVEVVLTVEELKEVPLTAPQIATRTRRDPVMARVLDHTLRMARPGRR